VVGCDEQFYRALLVAVRAGNIARTVVGIFGAAGTIHPAHTAGPFFSSAARAARGRCVAEDQHRDEREPVPGALSTLARYHFDPTVRNKLLFVRNEVEQGANVWQSMSSVDLLTEPEVRAMAIAERVDNRPWTLIQLAGGKRRRSLWRIERLSELLLPAVVILIGAFVLLQGLGMFMTLTQLVHSLA
jgi:hypothetical protein